MRESLTSPNDRLRTVAYSFFEHNPDRGDDAGSCLPALDKEQAEFVRPALMRALARRTASDPRVRQALMREVGRGEDFFRSAVIEALGDYKARTPSTRSPRSPSSMARCRTMRRWRSARSATSARSKRWPRLQRTAPRAAQPSIAAAICLLGVNCESHENYLIETLKFADKNLGFQELLRGAAAGLGALAVAGRTRPRSTALFDDRHPVARSDPRAGGAGARRPSRCATRRSCCRCSRSIRERAGGDRAARRRLRHARGGSRQGAVLRARPAHVLGLAEGSPTRALMQTLIGKLDF